MLPRRYAAGVRSCREGDVSDCMYLIESGVVDVIIGEDPDAHFVARLRRGDIIGEMGLLADAPRSASILAATPTQAVELDRASFTEMISRHPAILLNIS